MTLEIPFPSFASKTLPTTTDKPLLESSSWGTGFPVDAEEEDAQAWRKRGEQLNKAWLLSSCSLLPPFRSWRDISIALRAANLAVAG